MMKEKHKNIRTCKRKSNKNSVYLSKLSNRKNGGTHKRRESKIRKKSKNCRNPKLRGSGLTQYVFYAILNTDLQMNQGAAAATIANALTILFSKLDSDQVKYHYMDRWISEGRKIIVLKGYDHKHLKYLHAEVKFVAIGSYALRQKWGRNTAIIVLIVFGRREDLEEVFEGLSYLK